MKRVLIIVVLTILLAAAGANAIVAAQGGQPADAAEVAGIVRQFEGSADLKLLHSSLPDGSMPGLRTCSTDDKTAFYTVDLERRHVVSAVMPIRGRRPGPGVDRDNALRIARDFAAPRVQGFSALALTKGSLEPHGASPSLYEFAWTRLLGTQQAEGLAYVAVSVDATTGSVVSFMQVPPVPVDVGVEPSVSRDQAIAIASERFGAPVRARKATLQVWWRQNDRTQPQVLRWLVEVAGADSGQIYPVDAQTGDILQ